MEGWRGEKIVTADDIRSNEAPREFCVLGVSMMLVRHRRDVLRFSNPPLALRQSGAKEECGRLWQFFVRSPRVEQDRSEVQRNMRRYENCYAAVDAAKKNGTWT